VVLVVVGAGADGVGESAGAGATLEDGVVAAALDGGGIRFAGGCPVPVQRSSST
jgi:hypothetical protein